MKVSYITVEDVSNPLFETQITNVVNMLCDFDPSIEIDLYIFNAPWRLLGKSRSCIKNSFCPGVTVKIIPVLPPLRFSMRFPAYCWLVGVWLKCIFFFTSAGKTYDVYHVRSYHPMLALPKSLWRKVFFDPRSLLLDEALVGGEFVRGSAGHNYWVRLEKLIVSTVGLVTGVSRAMLCHYSSYTINGVPRLIPIASVQAAIDLPSNLQDLRERLGWCESTVCVYLGSVRSKTVNLPILESAIEALASTHGDKLRFLFVSREDPALFASMAKRGVFRGSDYYCLSAAPKYVHCILAQADFGLHVLAKQPDWESRLGTKVVDYWSAGLPVLVNEYVGEAASLTRENNFGLVLNDFSKFSPESLRYLLSIDRGGIARYANEKFSISAIVSQVIDGYKYIIESLNAS